MKIEVNRASYNSDDPNFCETINRNELRSYGAVKKWQFSLFSLRLAVSFNPIRLDEVGEISWKIGPCKTYQGLNTKGRCLINLKFPNLKQTRPVTGRQYDCPSRWIEWNERAVFIWPFVPYCWLLCSNVECGKTKSDATNVRPTGTVCVACDVHRSRGVI